MKISAFKYYVIYTVPKDKRKMAMKQITAYLVSYVCVIFFRPDCSPYPIPFSKYIDIMKKRLFLYIKISSSMYCIIDNMWE